MPCKQHQRCHEVDWFMHRHSPELQPELQIWPCEHYCDYCDYCEGERAKHRYEQCSHLRAHVMDVYIKREGMNIKLAPGITGAPSPKKSYDHVVLRMPLPETPKKRKRSTETPLSPPETPERAAKHVMMTPTPVSRRSRLPSTPNTTPKATKALRPEAEPMKLLKEAVTSTPIHFDHVRTINPTQLGSLVALILAGGGSLGEYEGFIISCMNAVKGPEE